MVLDPSGNDDEAGNSQKDGVPMSLRVRATFGAWRRLR